MQTEFVSLLLGAVSGWLAAFMLEYFKAKGKSLADKEDIRTLTKLVEDVKQENQLTLEAVKGRHQLRLAAIERRLDAHQEAYLRWRRLVYTLNTDQISYTAQDAQTWSDRNCLFLSPGAREAFIAAIHAAAAHHTIVNALGDDPEIEKSVQENLDVIKRAGSEIVAGAELPTMGEAESVDVKTLV